MVFNYTDMPGFRLSDMGIRRLFTGNRCFSQVIREGEISKEETRNASTSMAMPLVFNPTNSLQTAIRNRPAHAMTHTVPVTQSRNESTCPSTVFIFLSGRGRISRLFDLFFYVLIMLVKTKISPSRNVICEAFLELKAPFFHIHIIRYNNRN